MRYQRARCFLGVVMTIRTRVVIWDTAGYEADRIRDDYIAETYDQQYSQRRTVTGSTSKFEVKLGPVTTAKYLYISTDQSIQVYFNNSMECRYTSDALLIIGCQVTALHILATSDTNLFIYVAGD